MTSRPSRVTVPGRKLRKREAPGDVLECQGCAGPAIEIYAPVACWALLGGRVLCANCNCGTTLVANWRFIIGPSPHSVIGSAETDARIRCVEHGPLDMSGSKVTLLP